MFCWCMLDLLFCPHSQPWLDTVVTCHGVQDGTPLRRDLGSLQVGREKCKSGDGGDRSSIGSEDGNQ